MRSSSFCFDEWMGKSLTMSYHSVRSPLLEEEEGQDFICYDDTDLEAAGKLRRKRQRIKTCVWTSVGVFFVVIVGVGLFFITGGWRDYIDGADDQPSINRYKNAAVASDVAQCSQIGSDILQESSGNAVDAALATLLCMGLADPQSMGIGGGFFMTVYNRSTGESDTIDAREVAPLAATKDMFYDKPGASLHGGLAIAVPGEIRGYELAHKRFGSLPWKDVFQPAITMATDGFKVPLSLQKALQDFKGSGSLKEWMAKYPDFSDVFVNSGTGDLYKEGEMIKMPALGHTLKTIANEGADAFYNGSLASDIVEDMKQNKSGCIITAEDLQTYEVRLEKELRVTLRNKYRILAPQPPSGGVILQFILAILDGYDLKPSDLETKEGKILAHHRIIEAFKFAYAKRTNLADGKFDGNVTKLVANLTSKAYVDAIRAKIWDNQTHPVEYYGPTFYDGNKTSTAHLSVVDQYGNAVAVTSTVNGRFGSHILGKKTGIVFNNEMDDFATSNQPNEFGVYPSPANQVAPGKRPLSSMCPSVFIDEKGDARLVVGAAGGSKITTATAYVSALSLWFGDSIKKAIDTLRIHHQLLPDTVQYEIGFDQEILEGLIKKGHNVSEVAIGKSVVQGITRDDGYLYANSDYRKGGKPAGF